MAERVPLGVNDEAALAADVGHRGASRRDRTPDERLQDAERNDAAARMRDAAALARDEAAAMRDRAVAEDEAVPDLRERAPTLDAAELRAVLALHRRGAAEDRKAAARDRLQAARDRERAAADRAALVAELERAAVDSLTGARTRTAGLRELDREVQRAQRTSSPLVVAYVDVVGLKATNDTLGHAAGDALLVRVVDGIRAHVRPYDLLIRLGGDEFLCAMSNLELDDAHERFAAIETALSDTTPSTSIRIGFAQLQSRETADELIAGADSELIRVRRR